MDRDECIDDQPKGKGEDGCDSGNCRTLKELTAVLDRENRVLLKQEGTLESLDGSIAALEKRGAADSAMLREALDRLNASLVRDGHTETHLETLRELVVLVRQAEGRSPVAGLESMNVARETVAEPGMQTPDPVVEPTGNPPKVEIQVESGMETQTPEPMAEPVKGKTEPTNKGDGPEIQVNAKVELEEPPDRPAGRTVEPKSQPEPEKKSEPERDNGPTEEDRREGNRRLEDANEFLEKIASGIDGLGDKYDKMIDTITPSTSLLAGLSAAALFFLDPETLLSAMTATIDAIFAIFESIRMVWEGEFSEALELLGENFAAVASIIAVAAAWGGGKLIRVVSSLVKGVQGIVASFIKVGGLVSRFAGFFGNLARIFGRFFIPITIITGVIGAITGIIDGYSEEGITGAIKGGLKGLFNALVGWPLDMLKNAVSWILGAFGLNQARDMLDSFSFRGLFSDLVDGIFGMAEDVFGWFGTLFTDPSAALQALWDTMVGGSNWLVDLAYAPVNAAMNWLMGIFGWNDPDEPFRLQDMVGEAVSRVISFFTDLFDFIPSLTGIQNSLVGLLPDWMKPDTVEDRRDEIRQRITELERKIAASEGGADIYWGSEDAGRKEDRATIVELQRQLDDLPQANDGGIVDAPLSGTPVMLHGQEIITPLNSPQGKVLMAINNLMNARAEAGAGEYGGPGGNMAIQGGDVVRNSNTTVSNSNYNIQQGITPDDFIKRDFINFSY